MEVLIHNVRFVNTREQMLKVTAFSHRGIVEWSEFDFPRGEAHHWYTGGIDAHGAVDWIVRNNRFINIRSPGSRLAEHAIHFWNNSSGTLVERNQIINSDRGIGFGLGKRGHTDGIIRNNMVHTTRDVGIGLENAYGAKVYFNSVVTENYGNSIEVRFPGSSNIRVEANLVSKQIRHRDGGTS